MAAEILADLSRATDADSSPLAGAKWYFYASGTTTPQAVYANAALSVSLGAEVTADSGGKFPPIYMNASLQYRGVLKTSGGTTVQDIDPINSSVASELAQGTGAALVGFTQSGTGAVAETAQTALQRIRYATQYGMSPAASASTNMVALKLAIAATPTGGRLIIPEGTYTLDVTGGLSNAALINKAMTLQIDGRLQTNGHAVQANPCYMFKVTANYVIFKGSGTIAGDGSVNDANTGDDTTHPGLIWVDTVTGFVLGSDLTLETPPKVGILLVNSTKARISCVCIGGPPTYNPGIGEGPGGTEPNAAHTAYFYVQATGGSGHIFSLTARRASNGGRAVNAIFTSGTHGDCTACEVIPGDSGGKYDVWEKAFYGWGADHVVDGIEVAGAMTDAVRFMRGTNCTARGVIVTAGRGGIAAYDCPGVTIERCQIRAATQNAITIGRYDASYTGGFNGVTVRDNFCIGLNTSAATFTASIAPSGALSLMTVTVMLTGTLEAGQNVTGSGVATNTVIVNQVSGTSGGVGTYLVTNVQTVASIGLFSAMLSDGIRVNTPGSNSQDITVSGNRISNFAPFNGFAPLRVDTSGFTITRTRIVNNQITDTPQSGMILRAVQNSVIEGNKFGGIGTYFAVVSTSGYNRFINNVALDSATPSIGINGMASTDRGRGNQYKLEPLDGRTTMTAAVDVTLVHGGIASNAIITATGATNNAAQKAVRAYQNSGNITFTAANGAAFAGTEQYDYVVTQ